MDRNKIHNVLSIEELERVINEEKRLIEEYKLIKSKE